MTPVSLTGLSDAASIDRFMEGRQSPLIEPGSATLLYRGPARTVVFLPMMWGLPNRAPFTRIDGSDLWYLQLRLPEGARIEYKIEVDGRWLDDPLNPNITHNPFGSNSVLRGHGYQPPKWTKPDPSVPAGQLEDMDVRGRKITVYRPAKFSAGLPQVFVHDGGDYLVFAGLATVLDNLMQSQVVPPAVFTLSHPQERLVEYAANSEHVGYVVEEAIPAVAERYDTGDQRVVMGASLGAVAALFTAYSKAEFFGGMILQSGSYANHPGGGQGPFAPIAEFLRELDPSLLPKRVFLSCGTYEGTLQQNRMMANRLRQAELEVLYEEVPDGHAWEAWRDRLGNGLAWALGGDTKSNVQPSN